MTIDEMIAVLQAAKEGKEIQVREAGTNNDWSSLKFMKLSWNFCLNEYRAKPEPKMYWTIEEWIPFANAVGGKGFWSALSNSRTEGKDQGREWFSDLKESGRTVRLVEHVDTVVAECLIPQEEL